MKEKRPFSGGEKLLLLKPQTFMNNSGLSVMDAARFYKLPPERVLVLFDEAERTQNRIEQAALQTVEPTARIMPGGTRGGQERAEEGRSEEKETKEAEEVKEVNEETKEEIEGEIEEESV